MQITLKILEKTELTEFWKLKFGQAPFPYMSKIFISKYYIYTQQEKFLGGLSNNCKKQLDKLIAKYEKDKEINANDIKKAKATLLPTGTVLIRKFKGKKYEIKVLENGYEYGGKIYKSLSAVANIITGTRWNGKIFFGLKINDKK